MHAVGKAEFSKSLGGIEHESNFFLLYRQRWSPRGHILKSLALASMPQVLENCLVLGSRIALFFELLKVRGAPENFFGKRFFLKIA